jgi:hypothetical protein
MLVGPPGVYPRADVNPGLTNPDIIQDNIANTICNKEWKTASIRPPASYTTHLKIEQIAEYGFTDTGTKDYEEDHITSLRGTEDTREIRGIGGLRHGGERRTSWRVKKTRWRTSCITASV